MRPTWTVTCMVDTDETGVLTVSKDALEALLAARDEERDPQAMSLQIDVRVVEGTFVYDLCFVRTTTIPVGDHLERHGDLRVCVPARAVQLLDGAALYLHPLQGLTLRNPNRPRSVPEGLRDGDATALEIENLLEREVNPALALHGGGVRLVGHDGEGTVYLEMLGGCHGCGLSRQTMTDAVAATLREHLPTVRLVRDITDHTTGQNPYYP